MRATWLADVLRDAGLPVVEHRGWKQRGNGELTAIDAVTWHHDASAPGYSPGMADYLRRQVDAGESGANCWVTLDGTWHLIAAGMTYHAGRVLPGKPGNPRSLGVETDHTTGEPWSGVFLLDSLRRGTAAILRHEDRPASSGVEFHKTVCAPVGRKQDPDGLDLTEERAAVALLLRPTTSPQEDLLMAAALNDDDARWTLVLQWFVDYLGRVPESSDEHALHVWVFGTKGAGACLSGIVNSPESIEHRRRRAA